MYPFRKHWYLLKCKATFVTNTQSLLKIIHLKNSQQREDPSDLLPYPEEYHSLKNWRIKAAILQLLYDL
jgi:hypothetical protein